MLRRVCHGGLFGALHQMKVYLFGTCECDPCGDGSDNDVDPGRDDGGGDEWSENKAWWWGRYTIQCVSRESKLWPSKGTTNGIPNPPRSYSLEMIPKPTMISSGGSKE